MEYKGMILNSLPKDLSELENMSGTIYYPAPKSKYLTIECDNKSRTHSPKVIGEGDEAMRVYCTTCHRRYIIHKDRITGAPEKRLYAKIFKKEILQQSDNLFYKYYKV